MTPPNPTSEIEIRHCTTIAEYEECIGLEQAIWGEAIAVPPPIFVVARETGGQVFAAFRGREMVGFTLALAAIRSGTLFLHSHITAVLPELRDRGVGRRLKLFQRQDALKRGIDRIEWTFDPLELKNAHFNFVRLGAVARRFIPNCYGVTQSPLHAGLPTDRLVAEWLLNSVRVKSILADDPPPVQASAVRLALPANLDEIRSRDHALAGRIQADAGEQFARWFAQGYAATSIEGMETSVEYILEPAATISGLGLPAKEN